MKSALTILVVLILAPTANAATAKVHAHRGGPVLDGVPRFPENTMPAFRSAAKLRAVLELDVKLTEDRIPVVFHDDTLERTTHCRGRLAERTLSELSACRTDVLGSPGSQHLKSKRTRRRVPIPTLGRVLGFARRAGARVNVEIRNYITESDYDRTPGFANRVVDAVLGSRIPASRVVFSSARIENLQTAESRMPDAQFALLTSRGLHDFGLEQASSRRWDWVAPTWPVSRDYIGRAHARGVRVVPYTIDERPRVRTAARRGVDALMSGDPLMALRALDMRRPRVNLRILTRNLQRVKRRGRVPVRVRANESIRAALTLRMGRTVLGKARVRVRRAGARDAKVQLSRRGRRALASRRAARLVLVAKARDFGLNRRTARTSARLRYPRPGESLR